MAVMPRSTRLGSALPRGPHKLTREQVEGDQRRRLIDAMLIETAEEGYAATTVSILIERAQVSRKTFYAHFASREELLVAAFDTASAWTLEQVRKAAQRTGGSTRRLEAAMRKLARCALENPGAIELCTTDVAAAGDTGLMRRKHLMDSTGKLFEDCLTSDGRPAKLPGSLPSIVAGAVYRAIDTRLRDRREEELSTAALELARWVRSYHPAPTTLSTRPSCTSKGVWPIDGGYYGGRAPGTLTLAPLDYQPPAGKPSRGYLAHIHRERILDAVARLTAERGYMELTAQSIAASADVPERAFLAQFVSKDDAFTAACELGHTKAQAIVARAREQAPSWRSGVCMAITGLLEFMASEPLYTHMAFIDAPLAGPHMAKRHSEQAAAYARLLFEGAPQRRRPPLLAAETVVHGLFELAFTHAATRRTTQLPAVADEASYLALAPFLGASEAAKSLS
jgi:AcrR family transcriptional regulator